MSVTASQVDRDDRDPRRAVPTGGEVARSRLRLGPAFERNVLSWSKTWWVLLSGVFEPIFYLLGMGLGLGNLVRDIDVAGTPVDYATFVAAGLMASSAMTGSMMDATFNFYFKLKVQRTYDAMLNAPLGIADVLAGELTWAVVRGTIYATMFLGVATAFGAVDSWLALGVIPTAALIALSFGALGSLATTFVRSWADFEIVNVALLPLIVGSTTFFPLAAYPGWAQPFVQATPLYHGVSLMRDLTTGLAGWHDLFHIAYLVALGLICGYFATKRLDRIMVS